MREIHKNTYKQAEEFLSGLLSFIAYRVDYPYSGLNSVFVWARNSSKVIEPRSPFERSRTASVPLSASFAPMTSM